MILVIALLHSILQRDYYPKLPHVWVEVTRPMLGCFDFEGTYNSQGRVVRYLQSKMFLFSTTGEVPKACYKMKVGQKIELAVEQPYDAIKFNDYCPPQGCSPGVWVVFAPLEKDVGEYLKPTSIPDNLKSLLK